MMMDFDGGARPLVHFAWKIQILLAENYELLYKFYNVLYSQQPHMCVGKIS